MGRWMAGCGQGRATAFTARVRTVWSVAFSPAGETVASAHGFDDKVRLWKVP